MVEVEKEFAQHKAGIFTFFGMNAIKQAEIGPTSSDMSGSQKRLMWTDETF
jgi:hypothetical protein